MNNEYRVYLEEELKEAEKKFENAKKEAAEEIANMSFLMAEDFGAAYASHIDKVTSAAARIKAINEMIRVYDFFREK